MCACVRAGKRGNGNWRTGEKGNWKKKIMGKMGKKTNKTKTKTKHTYSKSLQEKLIGVRVLAGVCVRPCARALLLVWADWGEDISGAIGTVIQRAFPTITHADLYTCKRES